MKPLKRLLKGKTVLITAGPTREPIDAVRYMSNRSSGKMGYALASVARDNGARVILITGPTLLPRPQGIKIIRIETASQMLKAIIKNIRLADILIMAAAVSDFTPVKKIKGKIKRTISSLTLKLKPFPDILKIISRKTTTLKKELIKIGFAAETSSLISRAGKKLREKNLDVIIANDISRRDIGFESDYNQVSILKKDGAIVRTGKLEKRKLAKKIYEVILDKKKQR